jgi:hypothetical protein
MACGHIIYIYIYTRIYKKYLKIYIYIYIYINNLKLCDIVKNI